VYDSEDGTFGITGDLTLDGQNNPDAVFIFQMASTLLTGDGSNVVLINGATACNIFWQVGSSATLGTTSHISGHILATVSITANAGAVIDGSLLANSGAVTLSGNTIINNLCPNDIPNTGVQEDFLIMGSSLLMLAIGAWYLTRKKTA